jgi:hypothetical protein
MHFISNGKETKRQQSMQLQERISGSRTRQQPSLKKLHHHEEFFLSGVWRDSADVEGGEHRCLCCRGNA